MILSQTPWASNIYASKKKQVQTSHFIAAHIAVQQLSHWSLQSVGHGPFVCLLIGPKARIGWEPMV